MPDIVLMDIDMPEKDGLEVTELLRKELPKVKVLILSMHSNTEYVMRIIQSGASGYILKEAPTEELVRAIDTVTREKPFSVLRSPGRPEQIRPRRSETAVTTDQSRARSSRPDRRRLEQQGNRQQTRRRCPHVETHRERIMRKLNIHSVAGLTKFAISKGLISLNS